jgi:hypothetical protein
MKFQLRILIALVATAFSINSFADMISISCGTPAKKGGIAPVMFGSDVINPSPGDVESSNISYHGEDLQIAKIKTALDNNTPSGVSAYVVVEKAAQKGFDVPHREFEFNDLGNCTEETSGEVVVKSVGGFVGTRTLETVKGCTCDID